MRVRPQFITRMVLLGVGCWLSATVGGVERLEAQEGPYPVPCPQSINWGSYKYVGHTFSGFLLTLYMTEGTGIG